MNNKKFLGKRLVVIDGKGLFYRGFYAMPNLTNNNGISLGGVYGFSVLALQIVDKLKPDYIAIAWDKSKTNIRKRKQLYDLYKANRHPAPPEFYDQLPYLFKLIKALSWPLIELDDYEADDIMGSLAVKTKKLGLTTCLVTSDLDLLQLIDDNINLYILKNGLSKIEQYTADLFYKKYNIRVDQFVDFKSLRGDASDNIPGVKGIGEKTAQKLLQNFDNLDNVYLNLSLIDKKISDKLIRDKKMAFLSRDLVRIMLDAPVKFNQQAMDIHNINQTELLNILQEYNFNSVIRMAKKIFQWDDNIVEIINQSNNDSLRIAKLKHINLNKLTDLKLASQEVFLIPFFKDHEGLNLRAIIIANKKQSFLINFNQINQDEFVNYMVKTKIINKSVISFDSKRLIKFFLNKKIILTNIIHDYQLAAFLLNPLIKNQNIEGIIDENFNNLILDYSDLSEEMLILKSQEIASYLVEIYQLQINQIKQNKQLLQLLMNFDLPMLNILAKMELNGIRVDLNYFYSMSRQIDDMKSDLQQTIFGYADQEFNIESPKQLSDILFNQLNISSQGIKKAKNFYSTNSSQLEKIINLHPIIPHIIKFREIIKLKNTYLDVLPKLVDKHSDLHTTFNLTSTQTGRLSSSEPNLQNIPIRSKLGNEIRKAFIARPGYILLSADYSQFELRIAADLANDFDLIELFNKQSTDIHTETAARIYNCSVENVTSSMRRAAKAINFGILYGMSPHGLSIASGMNRNESIDFINQYKNLRKPLFDYMDQIIKKTRLNGYAETLFGRQRPLPEINSKNFLIRQAAERAAINMPIQGTEADLMKLAMIGLDQFLKKHLLDSNLLLQIHDSILLECRENVVNDFIESVKNIMENIYKLKVNLRVDIKTGYRWGDL